VKMYLLGITRHHCREQHPCCNTGEV